MNHVVGWLALESQSKDAAGSRELFCRCGGWVKVVSLATKRRRRRDGGKSGDGDLHIIFELEIPGQSTPSNENCIVSHMTGCWLLLVAAAVWYRQVV